MMIKDNKNYISFFGNIGVGKTTVGKNMQNQFGDMEFIEEKLDQNPYLEKFYHNMKQWGLLSTLEMLVMMAEQYKSISGNKKYVIFDNGIQELICYATLERKRNILSENEFITYCRLYNKFIELLPPVKVFVYFRCNIEIELERIQKRKRRGEEGIDRKFLCDLQAEYEDYVKNIPDNRVIYVETEDQVNLKNLRKDIIKKLSVNLKGEF